MSFDSPSIYQSPIKDNKEESLTYNEIGGEYPEDFPVTDLPTPIDDEQDNPVYILTSGNFLYRGSETPGVPIEDLTGIKWFGLDLKNVLEYGYPSQYKLNTNLRLLAIDEINEKHPFFIGLHGEIKRKFEIFIRINNGIRERVSIPQYDYDLCEYICNLGYDGYAMKEMKSDSNFDDDVNDMFHAEVALQKGNEKLSEPVHINVDELTYKDGRKLQILGKEATVKNIEDRIKTYQEQKEKMKKEQAAREAKEAKKARARGEMNLKRERDPPLFHNTMFLDEDNYDDNDPFVMRGNFNFGSPLIGSPPKRSNTDNSPDNFSYSSPFSSPIKPYISPRIKTGGKTKKRNRKTKKNKKKQTKKKNKKSKRKSNKKIRN
jgi:hypothetical protein